MTQARGPRAVELATLVATIMSVPSFDHDEEWALRRAARLLALAEEYLKESA